MRLVLVAPLLVAALAAQSPSYRAEVEAFRKQREAEIGGPTGWAALAGLHWLVAGRHTIGRAASNGVVLAAPSAPPQLGTIRVRAKDAELALAPGVTATVDGAPVRTAILKPNVGPDRAVVIGKMRLALIARGGKLALRVWDSQSSTRLAFHGLRWYPIDPAWRIDARFVPHTPPPRLPIANVLGQTIQMPDVGYAEFTVGGHTYRLEALLESDDAQQLFFMFRDGTTGRETYGAGRYLYTPLPKDGHVTLDFNEAKNPPCAFTTFATCPLPPKSNRLTQRIEAGERAEEAGQRAKGKRQRGGANWRSPSSPLPFTFFPPSALCPLPSALLFAPTRDAS
jgi:uncharacterized protein